MENRLAGLSRLDTFSACQFLGEHGHDLGKWVLRWDVQRDERCAISITIKKMSSLWRVQISKYLDICSDQMLSKSGCQKQDVVTGAYPLTLSRRLIILLTFHISMCFSSDWNVSVFSTMVIENDLTRSFK